MTTAEKSQIVATSSKIISIFLALVIFTSRLAISIKAIALVTSLVLILLIVPPKTLLKTFYQHPIARAAALLFACYLIGVFYSTVSIHDRLHQLKNELPLMWIGIVIAFFQTTFKRPKTQTYVAIFIYGAVLTTLLGCINTWHIINITQLIHSHLMTDPPEYPFGTFCFSLSFAAYLSAQKIKYATTKNSYICYLLCFLFLTFFIFFINHERTAYVLYAVLILFYGYQHAKIKGMVIATCWVSLLFFSANYSSPTFHHRTKEAVHDVKVYQHGNPLTSTGLRLFFIKESIKLWEKKPFFGYGTGSFKATYLTIDGYNMNGVKNTPDAALDQPHNQYADILVQLGLFGFAFFLWLLYQQTRCSFQLPHFEKQCAQALILAFIIASLDTTLFFYATSMTDYFFFTALFFAPLKPRHPHV